MHTQKKHSQHTYHTANRQELIRKKRKRRSRQLCVKCILCTSVFTFTLLAAAEWNIIKPQSDAWKQHTAELAVQLPADTDNQMPFSSNTDTPIQAVPERLQEEQLIDTTTDDVPKEHLTQVSSDWNLILVNPWNEIPDNYEISLTRLPNGHSVDSRCYPALTEMMNACRDAGCHPLICSSYRSMEKQKSLFQERIDELIGQGYSKKDARVKAATSVARPGTSEHQVGLAVDIVDKSHQTLDIMQEYTPVQQWLMENSWKYGFILRYPNDKSSLTGIIYEPWHYRYVGPEAAQEIYERGLCLEEYLEELQ